MSSTPTSARTAAAAALLAGAWRLAYRSTRTGRGEIWVMGLNGALLTAKNRSLGGSHELDTSGAGTRPLWMLMDGSGTAPGNVMRDIDAVSGAVVNKGSQR